jgi:hypothetical protein
MAMDERARCHWLAKVGRMDYSTLANEGSTIAEALCEHLRT